MSAFVIAKKNCEFLDSPVFKAGPNSDEEAVAVFTTLELAEQYVDTADWRSDYEVGELDAIQLVRWITLAHEQGITMVVVNPDRSDHLAGKRQSVVYLEEPLKAFAELLRNEFIKQAEQKAVTA